ncbi:hypothetical protein IPJ70_00095 [Candidatus Campbellbacteria bacterium]|nr:MAG: hypothetical protein IPJ70_00095 [Candidatus Campbellbacteria bacterium]
MKSIARLKDQLGDGENVESWVTYEDSKSVRELRWKIARPSFVPDVELGGDQTQVNFVVMVILQVTNVYKPVFEYGGNFLRAVDGIVANAVMDFASSEDAHGEKLTYKKLTGMKKGSSAGGGGENLIDRMKTQADRQLAEYGLSMVVAYLHDYDLSKDFRDIEEANRANELAKLQGDAKITAAKKQAEAAVEAAKGALEARKLEAEGEAAFWNFASEAHRNIGGDPNVLVAVRAQVAEAQALASEKSKVTTLVQRGQVALQISPEKKVAS